MKAIIFDFDGVIVNTYEQHYRVFSKVYENLDREKHKLLFEGILHESKENFKVRDNAIDEFKLLEKELLKKKVSKDVLHILKKLKKRYLLFIISSNKESVLHAFFEKENLQNLFDKIYGFETHKRKDIKFKLLLEEYNLGKNDVVFITDTLGDVLEAKKLGIKSIALDSGFHERERLEKGKPFKIVSKLKEILEIIEGM